MTAPALRPGDLHLGDRVCFKAEPANAYIVVMVSPRGTLYLKENFTDVWFATSVLVNEYDDLTAPAPAATSVSGAGCRNSAAPTSTIAAASQTARGDSAGPEVACEDHASRTSRL